MSIFVLAGFRAFTTRLPGILIPFLSLRGTNEVFVQEFDDNFRIARFHPFRPEDFESVDYPPPNPIPRELGQPGLMAFRLSREVLVGEAAEVRRQISILMNTNAHPDDWPTFLTLEASLFVGDSNRVRKAIAGASSKFDEHENGRMWMAMELSASHTEASQALHKQVDIAANRDARSAPLPDLRSPDWPRQWHRLFSRTRDRQLLGLAIEWIQLQSIENRELPSILLLALNSARDNVTLQDYAKAWLRQSEFNHTHWAQMWLILNTRASGPDFMIDEAIRFLEATADLADHQSVENWSSVWKRARTYYRGKLRKLPEHLVELAKRVAPFFAHSSAFVRAVLKNLVEQPFAVEILMNWLQSLHPTRLWGEIYVRLASGSEFTPQLQELGFAWLSEHPNINRWKNVWDILYRQNADREKLLEIAKQWIERAYPDIEIWPEVMATLIEADMASEVEIELAVRWLSSHAERKQTISYKKLESLIRNSSQLLEPRTRILHKSGILEAELYSLVKFLEILPDRKRFTAIDLQRLLSERRLIDPNTAEVLHQLTEIRNLAAHSDTNINWPSVAARFDDLYQLAMQSLQEAKSGTPSSL